MYIKVFLEEDKRIKKKKFTKKKSLRIKLTFCYFEYTDIIFPFTERPLSLIFAGEFRMFLTHCS